MMALVFFSFASLAGTMSSQESKAVEAFSGGKHFELALSLERLGLKQLATVEYLEAAKSKEERDAKDSTSCKDVSLSGLFNLADRSDDHTVLDYLIGGGHALPCSKTDALFFRRGEYELQHRQYQKAIDHFGEISKDSPRFFKARYLLSIALLSLGKEKEAINELDDLVYKKRWARENDYGRNVAMAGLARIHYKKEDWAKALEYYKKIPKDSELWHQVLTEMNWTNFRMGNFREVLGGLAGLHSPLYQDHFLAESVLLRSFVYLSICHLDEMSKTLDLYDKQYLSLNAKLLHILAAPGRYSDLNQAAEQSAIPLPLVRSLFADVEFKRAHRHVESVRAELKIFSKLSKEFKNSQLGHQGLTFLQNRLNEAVKIAGQKVQAHLIERQKELTRLNRQYEFARYELASATEREIKAPKPLAASPNPVTKEVGRSDFLARGLVLYPFDGEYWLDEPGNYRFIGQSRCSLK